MKDHFGHVEVLSTQRECVKSGLFGNKISPGSVEVGLIKIQELFCVALYEVPFYFCIHAHRRNIHLVEDRCEFQLINKRLQAKNIHMIILNL
jgi:hypothetical protein